MALKKASGTADAALAVRAFGTVSHDTNLIRDEYAPLLTRGFYRFIGKTRLRRSFFVGFLYHRLMPGMLGVPLVRMRYTEDCLAEACRSEGSRQYFILGAGMNTFALRDNRGIEVIELDHPLTQHEKAERLASAGFDLPPGLQLVPVDFSREKVSTALAARCIDIRPAAFISWNGVSYYLTKEAIRQMLLDIARTFKPGSRLVFDYMDAAAFDPALQSAGLRRLFSAVSRRGEPFVSGFSEDEMATMLEQCGLHIVEHHRGDMIHLLYEKEEVGRYRPLEQIHYVQAVVGEGR